MLSTAVPRGEGRGARVTKARADEGEGEASDGERAKARVGQ